MPPKLKRFVFKHGWWILGTIAISLVIGASLVPMSEASKVSVIMGIVGGLATFFYFVQKQRLSELEIFQRVFAGFNARYAELHAPLQGLLGSSKPLNFEELALLFDYFNLCAEEYLYVSAGIIDEYIWRSWTNGILQYLNDPRVLALWVQEEAGGSYYGLTLKAMKATATKHDRPGRIQVETPAESPGRKAA